MSRIKVAAAVAAAALGVLGFAGTAGASVQHGKPAATPACSFNCVDISSLELGPTQIVNAYIPGDNGTGAKTGQKVNLHYATDTQVNADFTGGKVGDLGDFCTTATSPNILPIDSYACINYPSTWPVYEANVSPFGNETGECAGVALPATAGENVTLRPCGNDAGSLWVGDLKNFHIGYTPLVSGAFTGFSHPLTLTVRTSTKHPQNQLFVEPENQLTGGYIDNSQMWTLRFGPAV